MRFDIQYLKGMLRFGLHEAVVVTSGSLGEPHAAAMGVRVFGDNLVIYPYIDTRTYKNIESGSLLSLAFTHNALVFCDVVLSPWRLKFMSGRNRGVYLIDADVDVYAEAEPKEIIGGNRRAKVVLRVLDVYPGQGEYFSYSRANSMLIEVLIYFTKIRALSKTGGSQSPEVTDLMRILGYAASLVRRLGSGELVECVDRVYEELNRLGVRS